MGHPVEGVSHRKGTQCCLSHGQAVAIGCVVAARVAHRMGLCEETLIQVSRLASQPYPFSKPASIPPAGWSQFGVRSEAARGFAKSPRRLEVGWSEKRVWNGPLTQFQLSYGD